MRIKIKTRHAQIGEEIKDYTRDKLLGIAEKSMPVIDANISIDKVKHEFVVEAYLIGKHINYHITQQHEDLHSAIDAMVNKMQRELRTAKEKVKAHHATHLGNVEAVENRKSDDLEDQILEPEVVEIHTMKPVEAVERLLASPAASFLLYVDGESGQLRILGKKDARTVYRIPIEAKVTQQAGVEVPIFTLAVERTNGGPVTVREVAREQLAVAHLSLGEAIRRYHNDASRPFYFYVNTYSGRPNILYYRENQKISLIVPSLHLYHQEA